MRVRRLVLRHFRGIPGELELDLRARMDEAPRSLLILGDNGTGKSSIVDGLEYAVRGRVSRLVLPRKEERRVVTSLAGGEPGALVEFDTGLTVVRGEFPSDDATAMGLEPVEGFALAPLALRRADILRFWEVPTKQRQLVFFQYFRGPRWGNRDAVREASLAEQRVEAAEDHRDAAIAALGETVQLPAGGVPVDGAEFHEWELRRLRRSHGTPATRRGRQVYVLPRRVDDALTRVRTANKALVAARKELETWRRAAEEQDETPGG